MCSPPKTPNELGKRCGTVRRAIGKSFFKLYSHLKERNICLSNKCTHALDPRRVTIDNILLPGRVGNYWTNIFDKFRDP